MTDSMTEAALFELLTLERRVDFDGTVRYYNALGQLHRVYGPAVMHVDGSRAWYQNGLRHRLVEPAVERADGSRSWFRNGKRHRVDGPAIEYGDGSRSWFRNGKRHRVDGPAIEYAGYRAWYINGMPLTEAAWLQVVANMENV